MIKVKCIECGHQARYWADAEIAVFKSKVSEIVAKNTEEQEQDRILGVIVDWANDLEKQISKAATNRDIEINIDIDSLKKKVKNET